MNEHFIILKSGLHSIKALLCELDLVALVVIHKGPEN